MLEVNLNDLWKAVDKETQKQLDPENLAKWKQTIDLSIQEIDKEQNIIYLKPSDVFVHVLIKNPVFWTPLNKSFEIVTGTNFKLIIEEKGSTKKEKEITKKYEYEHGISGKYKFSDYVVSPENKLLMKACVTVAENFNGNWSPLFIHGKSGTGKTHLLQSIGYNILKSHPNTRVKYINAYDFLGIVQKIGTNRKQAAEKYEELKKDFYSFDILLIDDIQTLSGKEKSKEIMFSIFRHYDDFDKQIVAASDTSPDTLKGFEERFITRFKSNLLVKVSPPDVITARKILEKKLKNDPTFNASDIDTQVIEFVAQNFSSDVRSLEGALSSLTFWAISNNKDKIEAENIPNIFSHLKQSGANLTIDKIIKEVAKYYSVKAEDIKSKKRHAKIAMARHVVIYLSKQMMNATYMDIGKKIGGRDHSTIMSSFKKINDLTETSKEMNFVLQEIKNRIEI